ncbi:MarR family winged helix-turn-helix transcriptional regulator [Mycetocola reblochoni]|uniref:Transcriptional regulator, MarR family n=2 Tax=Mycetocola reblochoni TaxID=331618 RepID=A0A1R4JWE6_9MICO|nr:MarR family transcriptional regulator [Mycetocola reblochoni]RLP70610.1 MarR family transcriptional regulator [Mycetocola reblochoni]SJN36591.1 Transcriptional regulator, MarR family [Mycetocola reblochoni REB411]
MTAAGASGRGPAPLPDGAGPGPSSAPSPEQITALESALLGIVTEAKRTIHARAERIAPDMQRGTFTLFTQIARLEPISAGSLAELLSLDRSVVSRSAKTLVEAGLIERHPNPSDGRGAVFSASARGRAMLDEARSAESARLRTEMGNWSAADVTRLTELLSRLAASATRI